MGESSSFPNMCRAVDGWGAYDDFVMCRLDFGTTKACDAARDVEIMLNLKCIAACMCGVLVLLSWTTRG